MNRNHSSSPNKPPSLGDLLAELNSAEWSQSGPVGDIVRARRAELELAIVKQIEAQFGSSDPGDPWTFRRESASDGAWLLSRITGWSTDRAHAVLCRYVTRCERDQ